MRIGGCCAGSTQNIASLDKTRNVIDVGDAFLAQSYNLDSLTRILHHAQLVFVTQ